MQCKNHADRSAIERCAGCAEPFCGDCLVEMHGQRYCGSCKVMALKGQPIVFEGRTRRCKEADEALRYAIVGIFFCGIVLEPVALSKAAHARRALAQDPTLTGSGKVTAASIIAIITLGFWALFVVSKVVKAG